MVFEELQARLERLLSEQGRRRGSRASADGLYQALLETKVAVGQIEEALQATGRELRNESQHLADAERRGRLARDIGDGETAELADVWIAKHRERIELLERKLRVQQDELRMAERQLEELGAAYRQARSGLPRDLPDLSPGSDPGAEQASAELDRKAKQALVEEQLAALKRKMGK